MSSNSPYVGEPTDKWYQVTASLVKDHPLSSEFLVKVVLSAWEDIFHSRIGKEKYQIGQHIFPKPQILGFFLHELIPLKIEHQLPGEWVRERSSRDKDLIFLADDRYSIEIKTSSQKSIFGNRSFAQETSKSKKSKSGYYLAINFEKCEENIPKPRILRIRFGWLDQSDWTGQKAQSGQQARLSPDIERNKLIDLYSI